MRPNIILVVKENSFIEEYLKLTKYLKENDLTFNDILVVDKNPKFDSFEGTFFIFVSEKILGTTVKKRVTALTDIYNNNNECFSLNRKIKILDNGNRLDNFNKSKLNLF